MQVEYRHRGDVVDFGKRWSVLVAQTAAGLVEVKVYSTTVEVDDVGGAGAVDIREPDAFLVELVRVVKPIFARARYGPSMVIFAPNRP